MALPDDILVDVFSYLPAKSAGRFRVLSRSWRAELTSASFIKLHRRQANKPGQVKLFFSTTAQKPDEESYFYAWHSGGAIKKLMPNNFYFPVPLTRPLHGLVLIRCRDDVGYCVCNPSTGAVLDLPDSKVPSKMIYRCSPKLPYYIHVCYGFGYCSVSGEYKAVRIFSKVGHDHDEYSPILCDVFVLNKLAYWRPTTQQPRVCIVKENNPGVFLNGCLHFLCHDGGIIALDVRTEMFSSVLPPLNLEDDAPMKIMELNGCLCIFHGNKNYGDGTYRIWMLRNYEQGQWEQLCRVDPKAWTKSERLHLQSHLIDPLGVYNNEVREKKVLFATGNCKVFGLDVPRCVSPEILFSGDEEISGSFGDYSDPVLGLFEESLVHVGHTIEEMVKSSPTIKAWFDILKWMPARSVAKLSLVCKEWRAMVKDDRFIRSHVTHANLHQSPRIMIITDYYFVVCMDLKDFNQRGRVVVHVPELVCSQPCQGLNVFSSYSESFVCNPTLGYFERMDFPNLDNETFYASRIGLGYNSKNNEHVLVLITYKQKNFMTREYILECRLRYVNEKEYSSLNPPSRPVADIQSTYVDGKIYWMAEPNLGPISQDYEIVAFDVDIEEFQVIPGPPRSGGGCEPRSILMIQGSLSFACSDKCKNVIDIWMMTDVGTWLKEYHIELEGLSPEYSSQLTTPLAVDPKDGRILLNTGWSLGYYDPKTAAMETICRKGMPGDYFKFCPIICDESFVTTLDSFI